MLAITTLHKGKRIDRPERHVLAVMRALTPIDGRRRSTDKSWSLDPPRGEKYESVGTVKKGLRKALDVARDEGFEPHEKSVGETALDGVVFNKDARWARFIERAGVELDENDGGANG